MSISVIALNLARALAHEVMDSIEPLAARPIDDAERERLAAVLHPVLVENIPPLPNLVSV
ncbi:hypothetical protein [Burkholderia multivorans]|uniref:hypothetical protein n=1 Tax=Burkholderia multivorans TaxID=87883 RepID=UPI000CFEC40D|nr:hypothetical protein [Burkholderia multivorans]PRG37573.1 hypothetical protein C6T62_15180 [Burkholderia multivorans]